MWSESAPPPPIWVVAILVALVVAAAVTDLRRGLVPNWLTLPGIGLALLAHTVAGWAAGGPGLFGSAWAGTDRLLGLSGSLYGLAAGFLPLLVFWLAGGMGGGDAKLMGAIGAWAGWRLALDVMLLGVAVAAVMAIVVMVRKRVVRRTLRRVWDAVLLVLLRVKPADPTSADSPKIPFALALCLGTLLALGTLWL